MKLDWIFLSLFVVVAVLGNLLASECSAQVTVQIRDEQIKVSKATVQLGDIAAITAPNQATEKLLRQLDLDSFQGTSNLFRATKEQVRIRLLLAGHDVDTADIAGPDVFVVQRVDQQDTRQIVEQLVRAQLSQTFTIPESAIQVTLDANFKIANEGYIDFQSLRLEPLGRPDIPLGKVNLSAMVRDTQNKTNGLKIPVTVAIFRELAVAKMNIPRGAKLTEENIEAVRRPVSTASGSFLTVGHVLGKTAKVDIAMYELVKPTAVNLNGEAATKLIKRNSMVPAVLRQGQLSVMLREVKVLEDGDQGDTIEVLNLNNNERMWARVVDANLVELR